MKKKQTYKGKLLTRTKIKNNILSIYKLSDKSDKYDWYAEANAFAQELADDYDIHLTSACGIIASLSPLKQWEQNKQCAISFLDNGNGKHMQVFQRQSRTDIIL